MRRDDRLWLAIPALLFLVWHIPLMYRTEGGQDEDWYGVPGSAILRAGVPQNAYISSDDPGSVCYKTDVALYTLPPLSFYAQAMVHLVLGDGIGPARTASTIAGLGAAYLVYSLTVLWFGDRRGALLAASTYLFCRPFLFPSTTARPDMLTAALGLLSIWFAARYAREPRRRWFLPASGAAAGLSMLSHPFGIVVAIQVGLFILAIPGNLGRRLLLGLIFGVAAMVAFGFWVPLIAPHPELFRIQFGENVLGRAGPGLGETVFSPVELLTLQFRQVWEFLSPTQFLLFGLGLVWTLVRARRFAGGHEFTYHFAASTVLLILFMGRHFSLAYYVYPAAMASQAVGMLGSDVARWLEGRFASRPAWPSWLVAGLIAMALLPGSGLRAIVAHARHWNREDYNARRMATLIMNDIPHDAVTAVDCPYVLDFHLAGRRVFDSFIQPCPDLDIYDFRDREFDYVVFARGGLKRERPQLDDIVLIKTYGDPNDPFACYAELYRRNDRRPLVSRNAPKKT